MDSRDQARGYRLRARRDPISIRLLTRNGHDWAARYSLLAEAIDRLKVRSCLIDGEAVACDENGLAVFERLRRKPSGKHVFLYTFRSPRAGWPRPTARAAGDAQGDAREPATLLRARATARRAPRAQRRCRLPPRLPARLRGHRVEAPGLADGTGSSSRTRRRRRSSARRRKIGDGES